MLLRSEVRTVRAACTVTAACRYFAAGTGIVSAM
jgi:hypothetical protein